MSETDAPLPHALDVAEETVEELEEDVELLRGISARTGWFRIEYGLAAMLSTLLVAYLLAYFVFDVDLDALKDWGYLGIFFIAMAGSATIVLPTPSTVAIFIGSAIFVSFG